MGENNKNYLVITGSCTVRNPFITSLVRKKVKELVPQGFISRLYMESGRFCVFFFLIFPSPAKWEWISIEGLTFFPMLPIFSWLLKKYHDAEDKATK